MYFYQRIYLKILERRKDWKKERKIPGGYNNPDKVFYVVRRSGMKLGLFSIFNTHLARVDYALQNGMIPVIDMQNFNNSYLDEGEFAFVNAWEKYFEQPTEYSLKEVYASKNIILSDAGVPGVAPNNSMDFFSNYNGELSYWRKKCREYIRLKPHVKETFEETYRNLFDENDKVLGVLARGTDYVKLRPSKHPIQPTTEQLIEKADEVMQMYGCNKIFLATEDKEIADAFFAKFGNKCMTNTQDYVDYKEGYLAEIKSENENGRYLRGFNYLITILILARCSCIVAGRTSGTVGAALMSDGWEYSHFFDLGYYG